MRRGFALTGTTAVVVGLVLGAGSAATAMQDVPETGTTGRLVLSSAPYPAQFVLTPGEPAHWRVDARLEDAVRAELEVELHSAGALTEHPRGLRLDVRSCTDPWQDGPGAPTCGAGERAVATHAGTSTGGPGTGPRFTLDPLVAGAPEHLLVSLAVEDSAAASADETLMGLTNEVGLGLRAVAIDDVPVPSPSAPPSAPPGAPGAPGSGAPPVVAAPPGQLPRTGADPVLLALAAAAALALGAGLLGAARRPAPPTPRRG
ncbi:LPXTG cell wall anchor domain-containing protein [Cellulomonas iranensis]|uniref:LPXTG cell wall anchor domain-containing protein n=1 Tax=Cellulomonas iranensis TaxID=76862 RepID=UPI000B3CAB88|nr:LPXTG cell wall anchor domain-containing protein [Cellulomonas iranensis]